MNAFFQHGVQSTVFALFAWLLVRTLLRNNQAQTRYWVYLAASLKFLIPFSLLVDLGHRATWLRAAVPGKQAAWDFAVDRITRATPSLVSPVKMSAGSASASLLPDVLFAVWLIGLIWVCVRWWRGWRNVRATLAAATPLRQVDGIAVLSAPEFRERGLEPGVFGLFRSVIVVPEGITEHLTAEQFEAVLEHEATHVHRMDNLAAAAQMAVEAVFWFHPLVWWLGRRLVEEREHACDEAVLNRRGDPAGYAEAILNVCKFYVEPPIRCVSGVTGADLKQRIEEIMTHSFGQRIGFAKRAVLVTLGLMVVIGPAVLGLVNAQAPSSFGGLATVAAKQFEVATVKLNPTGNQGWRLGPPGKGSVEIVNLELKKIIASSFRIQDSMVFGPGWIGSTRYDIVGKGPDSSVANPEVWEMMRSLLRERFQLKYHLEARETSVWALVVAKGGPKLGKPENGQCAEAIKAGQTCGDILFHPYGVGIYNMPIGALIGGLGRKLQDRPIVDKTGLTGKYDTNITWLPDGMKLEDTLNAPKEFQPEDISLFEAIEKQAGLRLEAQKVPIQVVVIDSIERPSEN